MLPNQIINNNIFNQSQALQSIPKQIINNNYYNKNLDPKQRYTLVKNLGKGGFGAVSLYFDNISKRQVVTNKINKS